MSADQRRELTLGRVLLPLRAFLGVTYCFAGLQKLANPAFFRASNPASIQAQLAGAARRSPIHSLVTPLGHVAVLVGLLIAFGELAVGVGTLLGLWARAAAAGGLLLSLLLFLTVSFHSSPYYTGSDIVFAFAWTPLVLAGAGPVLSLDTVLADRARRPEKWHADGALSDEDASRREAVLKGVVTAMLAIAGLAVGGITSTVGRLAGGTAASASDATKPLVPAASGAPPSQQASANPSSQASANPSSQTPVAIGPAKNVPVGGSASFTDPVTHAPSIVIQLQAGAFVAFDAVCPHAGCIVQYDAADQIIVCPCHGSEFDPATGAVEVGPAVTGLIKIPVGEGPDGELYVT
jgi:thiosulfate dehydrogenase (quinone) large subunit